MAFFGALDWRAVFVSNAYHGHVGRNNAQVWRDVICLSQDKLLYGVGGDYGDAQWNDY